MSTTQEDIAEVMLRFNEEHGIGYSYTKDGPPEERELKRAKLIEAALKAISWGCESSEHTEPKWDKEREEWWCPNCVATGVAALKGESHEAEIERG